MSRLSGLACEPGVEPPEEQAAEQQNHVQPEGGILVVGQPRMRALGMKSLEDAVDEILALVAPFVQVPNEEWRLQVSQHLPSGLALIRALRWVLREAIGRLVQQGLEKAPALAVGRGPIAPPMSVDRLVEMPERNGEIVALEQQVNFIVGGRHVESLGQGPSQSAVFDEVASAGQCQHKSFPGAMQGHVFGGLLHDKIRHEPVIAPNFRIVTKEPKELSEPLTDRSVADIELVKAPAQDHVLELPVVADGISEKAAGLKNDGPRKRHGGFR